MPTEESDALFETIGLHLMTLPPATRLALEDPHARPATPAGAPAAIESARSWLEEVLQPAFRPAPDTVFLAVPAESGVCDTVRAVYRANRLTFEMAQSRHVLSLRLVDPPGHRAGNELERVCGIAAEVFSQPTRLQLQLLPPQVGLLVGRQSSSRGGDPDWLDELRWWIAGDDLGFLTVKDLGGAPGREFISPDEDDNRVWFLEEG